MKLKFIGELQVLQDTLLAGGVNGRWKEQPHNVFQLIYGNGASMSWASTTGTIWFDGPPKVSKPLEERVEALLQDQPLPSRPIAVVKGKHPAYWREFEEFMSEAGFGPEGPGDWDRKTRALGDVCRRDPKAPGAGLALLTPDSRLVIREKSLPQDSSYRSSPESLVNLGRMLAILPAERCAIISPLSVLVPETPPEVKKIRFGDFFEDAIPEIIDHLTTCGLEPVKPLTRASKPFSK